MKVTRQVLPYRVLTVDETNEFVERLQVVSEALFEGRETDSEVVLKRHLLSKEYDHFHQYIGSNNMTVNNQQEWQNFFQGVLQQVLSLELIVLRLAFLPRMEFSAKLVEWFDQYGPGFGRIQFVFDKAVVGGFILEYNGRIHDYSVSKDLTNERLSALS